MSVPGFWPLFHCQEYHLFSITGQLTPPPEATPLTPPTPLTPLTPPTHLTPQSSIGADLPQPSRSVEELSSQPATYQPESVQAQPLRLEEEIRCLKQQVQQVEVGGISHRCMVCPTLPK